MHIILKEAQIWEWEDKYQKHIPITRNTFNDRRKTEHFVGIHKHKEITLKIQCAFHWMYHFSAACFAAEVLFLYKQWYDFASTDYEIHATTTSSWLYVCAICVCVCVSCWILVGNVLFFFSLLVVLLVPQMLLLPLLPLVATFYCLFHWV